MLSMRAPSRGAGHNVVFWKTTAHLAGGPEPKSDLLYCFWCEEDNTVQHGKQTVTFSTSVGLAIEEEMTPEKMPHATLISNVSSEGQRARSLILWKEGLDVLKWKNPTTPWSNAECKWVLQRLKREEKQPHTFRSVNKQPLKTLVCTNFYGPIRGLPEHGRSNSVNNIYITKWVYKT